MADADRAGVEQPSLRVAIQAQRGLTLEVTFEAPPGITVLFGASGAGKSTTLAAIAGLLPGAQGRVSVGEEAWLDSARGIEVPVHLRNLAFVFQSLALFPHLTAAENVAYGLERSLDRQARRAQALALLERMQVPHLADRRPRTFSGGEAQRVALARAFARKPRVLLLDEPFSAMDRRLRAELGEEVRRYVAEARIPAILVTHHRLEARSLGERVVVLESGRVLAAGGVAELVDLSDRDER